MKVLKLIYTHILHAHTMNMCRVIIKEAVAQWVSRPGKTLWAFGCLVHCSRAPRQCSENLSWNRPTFKFLVDNLHLNQKCPLLQLLLAILYFNKCLITISTWKSHQLRTLTHGDYLPQSLEIYFAPCLESNNPVTFLSPVWCLLVDPHTLL